MVLKRIFAVSRVSILELFRRRDVYAALILVLVLSIPLACINFFGVEGIVRYIREISLLLIWVFSIIITITNAARQIPGEIQRRTIYPLLSKPIGRGELVIGKFLGSTAASTGALLIFYALFIVLTGIKSQNWISPALLQGIVLHVCFVVLVNAMTILGSLLLTPSANITCCLLVTVGILIFGAQLPETAATSEAPVNIITWAVNAVIPHFEFFDMRLRIIHNRGTVNSGVFCMVIAYAAFYTAVFVSLTVAVFKRKRT